ILHFVDIHLPKNSATPVIIGAAAFLCTFGLVWHIGWATIGGASGVLIALIVRSFQRATERVVSADQQRSEHQAQCRQVDQTRPVGRDDEDSSANAGLAQARL
ncbi:MAG TPA: cytochrome ubiquinol oxidase subunit I, partial [Pseudomonas sp.]|nr:cytochrome ubiquinol oxidase subunit I [Pseudomonas sp.]